MEPYTEAEIQLLIALLELSHPIETPNNNYYTFYPTSLDEAATYFRRFRTDWTEAYSSLAAKGLLRRNGAGEYALTTEGIQIAGETRAARPPNWYWYKDYYTTAPYSPAYGKFCQALYGRNLCQTNFSDMEQLQALLHATKLSARNRVLDLGCGVGLIAEYIADVTGALVMGLDYITEAIEAARTRTAAKGDRLRFEVGNLDFLPFPAGSFDTLISIDTLYMPNNLDDTLQQMAALLPAGGQMAIFYSHMLWGDDEDRASLRADQTPLGKALAKAGLRYSAQDFSAATHVHLQRKRIIAQTMQAAFAAENRSFLYDYIMAESESSPRPYDPATSKQSRYLYHVQT